MPMTAPNSATITDSDADHRPDLAALHPDRAEQPDLPRSLEHRQHQRVDDPDQRDEHGQREQHVHQPEQLVDLVLLGLLELGPGLVPDVGVRR